MALPTRSERRQTVTLEPLEPRILLTGTFSGYVRDIVSNAAIAGAQVQLFQNGSDPNDGGDDAWGWVNNGQTQTDANGYYQLTVDPRHYRLNVADGAQSNGKHYTGADVYNVVVVDQQNTSDNVQLRQAGIISGHVYDDHGAPLANAQVVARASYTTDGNNWHNGQTDQNGLYQIFVAPTDNAFYPVEVDPASSGTTYFAPQIASGLYAADANGTQGPDFHLAVGGTLQGRIADFGGNAIPNIQAFDLDAMLPNGEWDYYNTSADGNGDFTINGVPTGTDLWLRTGIWNFINNQSGPVYYGLGDRCIGPFQVAAGQTLDVGTLELPQVGTVSGVLKDHSGNPIPGVEVGLWGHDMFGGEVSLGPNGDEDGPTTDSNGDYTFDCLPPGEYTMSVATDGYAPYLASQPLYVASGQNTSAAEIDLTATNAGASFSGTISNFSSVAPKNQNGVVLPFHIMEDYDSYGLPSGVGVTGFPSGMTWTTQTYLMPDPYFDGEGDVADGYQDYFVPTGSPAAGSFQGDISAGAQTLFAYRDNGVDLATGSQSNLLSDGLNITALTGGNLVGLSLNIPIGTATVNGAVSVPPEYTPNFAWGSILIWLRPAGSTSPGGRAVVTPGPSGEYELPDLPAGNYTLYAVARDMTPYTSSQFSVSAGQTVTKNITFSLATDATSPRANLYAQDQTLAGTDEATFMVTYWDNVNVNRATIDNSDVRLTGPNSFNQPATLVSIDKSANGQYMTATYEVAAPGGWHSSDNGTYSVTMQANQVSDTSGNKVGAGTLGQFDITYGDAKAPTAVLAASNVTNPGGTTQTFTVTYSDNVAVDVSDLDGSDVRVTGPNGFNQMAQFLTADVGTDGSPRVATYSITPPGGAWDSADNGLYTVLLEANQVSDTSSNEVAAGTLGQFQVTCAAAASKLVFTAQPANGIPGATLAPVSVSVEDQYGNVVTSDNSSVTVAIGPGSTGPGTLNGTLTVAAVNGVATFSDLSISAAGTYTLQATDDALTPATSASFNQAVNDAPTLTTVTTLPGATEDTPFTITYATLAAAANEADAEGDPISFRVEAVSTGTLKKGGVAVVPGTTLLGAGESLVWTSAANANGAALNAFTVKAWDGALASTTAVQVKVQVAAVNDAPTVGAVARKLRGKGIIAFAPANFAGAFNDTEGASLQKVKITSLPLHGTLYLGKKAAVIVNQEIPVAQLATLSYRPASKYAGTDSFGWNGSDGAMYAVANALVNLMMEAVPPTVSAFVKAVGHNTALAFAAADFTPHFADADPADSLQKVKITKLPKRGILKLNGVALTKTELKTREFSLIDLGNLTYTPTLGYSGADRFSWSGSDGFWYAKKAALVSLTIS